MSNEMAIAQDSATFVERIENKVVGYQQGGQLDLPPDYSVSNALRSAYLLLQEVKDKNKKPALKVCTNASVYNSLLQMAVMGLNPAKKQCYFVVYGNQLTLMRSYFGAAALARRVRPEIKEVVAQAIYADDEFSFEIENGQRRVTKHTQTLAGMQKDKIVGAYAVALNDSGEVLETDIMTMEEIKAAWKMSKMYPIKDDGSIKTGSTHDKFTADMVKKTVISRLCKPIINSSSDASILGEAVQQNAIEMAKGQLIEEVAEEANKITFQPEEFPEIELPSAEEIAEAATEEVEENPFDED
jgi:recombination protein RecT